MSKTVAQRLSAAIRSGEVKEVRQIIDNDAKVLSHYILEGTLLHYAARYDNVAMVKMLIEAGLDVNAPGEVDPEGPLYDAAVKGRGDVARVLLDHGAEVNAGGGSRPHPLISAVHSGSLEIVQLLLDRGADVNASYLRYGEPTNALSFAEMYGQEEIAKLLRKHGAVMPGENAKTKRPAKAKGTFDSRKEILKHYREYLGSVKKLALQEIVPASDEVSVAVHVSPPTEEKDCVSLVTVGMSERPMNAPEGEEEYRHAELAIHLPADWPLGKKALQDEAAFWPIRWLRQIAYYPHENETWLGGPFTIIANGEPPEPLGPGTEFTCLLLLTDDEEDSRLQSQDGRIIHFYNVYPIYTEERDLELNQGIAALLEALAKHEVGAVVDTDRGNVAAQKSRRSSKAKTTGSNRTAKKK